MFEISKVETHDPKPLEVLREEAAIDGTDEEANSRVLMLINNGPKELESVWKKCFIGKSKAVAFYNLLTICSQEKIHLYQEKAVDFTAITVSAK